MELSIAFPKAAVKCSYVGPGFLGTVTPGKAGAPVALEIKELGRFAGTRGLPAACPRPLTVTSTMEAEATESEGRSKQKSSERAGDRPEQQGLRVVVSRSSGSA